MSSAQPSTSALLTPALTPGLTAFIADGGQARFPEDIRELARLHILDTLAAIVICRDLPAARAARRFAEAHSGGIGRDAVTMPGHRDRAALIDAAFVGAVTGHAAEINDFSPTSFVQPGPPIVAAALCVSQARGASGEQMLRAVIKGYEIACRSTKALGVHNLQLNGLQSHSIGGTFGTAATAASLISLAKEKIDSLLSYCAQQASGSTQWPMDEDHIEKAFLFAGMPARNGLQAALMCEAGFTGVPNSLDRPGSWITSAPFSRPGSDLNRSYFIEKLGERFELPLVAIKRYASAGPTQAALEGVATLMARIGAHEVERIDITIPSEKVASFATSRMPNLNLKYLAAILILDGRLDFDAAQSQERMDNDDDVRAMMRRINLARDPSATLIIDSERSAKVTVARRNGELLRIHVPAARGSADAPMNREDVEQKAMDLMSPVLGDARCEAVIAQVRALDRMSRAGDLLEMIAR